MRAAGAATAWLLLAAPLAATAPVSGMPLPVLAACAADAAATEPPAYYAIELVPTRRVPGTGSATGLVQVTFRPSPFGVALSPDGAYDYALDVRVDRLRLRPDAVYVVWAASADLKNVERLGVLGENLRLEGRVTWNKFLVIVSLESPADQAGERWQGPAVMRGMSRSGMMHTMAGHGPFELEPCIKYGYK